MATQTIDPNQRSNFENLDLRPTATWSEVKEAYRLHLAEHNPDINGNWSSDESMFICYLLTASFEELKQDFVAAGVRNPNISSDADDRIILYDKHAFHFLSDDYACAESLEDGNGGVFEAGQGRDTAWDAQTGTAPYIDDRNQRKLEEIAIAYDESFGEKPRNVDYAFEEGDVFQSYTFTDEDAYAVDLDAMKDEHVRSRMGCDECIMPQWPVRQMSPEEQEEEDAFAEMREAMRLREFQKDDELERSSLDRLQGR